jgi:hypothetical protein
VFVKKFSYSNSTLEINIIEIQFDEYISKHENKNVNPNLKSKLDDVVNENELKQLNNKIQY